MMTYSANKPIATTKTPRPSESRILERATRDATLQVNADDRNRQSNRRREQRYDEQPSGETRRRH